MKLRVANCNTQVVDASEEELDWLYENLSFVDEQASRQRNGGRRGPAVRVPLFNVASSTFPTGYLPRVWIGGHNQGFQITIDDLRVVPCQPDPNADLEWLRHHPQAKVDPITHQIAGVQRALAKRRGILWCPTGSGKTEIGIGIVKSLPCRWVFLVNSGDLLIQTAKRYHARTGLTAGVIGDGEWRVEQFTVAMFQTLHARVHTPEAKKLFAETEGIIVDEAHTLPASTFYSIAMRFKKAFFRFGMSATPLARGDRRSTLTVAALGNVIFRVLPRTLIDAGIIAEPVIRFVPVVQHVQRATYQGVYGEAVVRSASRNRALIDIVRRCAKPALLFVKEVAHGEDICKRLLQRGVKTEFVFGQDSPEEREAAIRRLERGDTDIIVCSVVFQTGIDIPILAAVINGAAMRSMISTIQRLGRGMRATFGKTSFEVWDIDDRGSRFLETHSKARLESYRSEGYNVTVETSGLTSTV